ncbi:MAG: hypothetical protein IPJ75_13995 [Ignavibacteriales bacterium]|nr:hypothetical protein [Ignavibacteriales bacterium]
MKRNILLFVFMLAGFIQAQWLPANVRFSGTAPESITYIYGDNKMVVLLIGTNYLYKSFDNGVVWMVDWFDPAEKQTKIGGTEGGHLLSVGQDLVKYYFSTNRGGSWKIVKTGLQNTGAIVEVKGSRNNLFFIALPQKLYRKSPINDSLLNLTLPLTGNETIRNLAAFKTSGEILFTTSTGRVFRSSNDGTDWNEIANFNTIFSTFETYGNSNIVLVGIKGSQTTLYSSTNKGITWDSLSMPFSCVEIHMTTPARGFAKAFTNELYYTVDSMKTWTKHQSLKMLRGCTTSGEKGIMIPPSFEVNSTSNSGENWQQISELNTNLAKAIEILADNSAYALTASGETLSIR